ncbi:MAG: SIMPL domain-containing protein [Lachnospiraceae bacterium]|nr:SIMPL domain-containing protein [Lachnospiraceae bacterium]
MKKRFAGYEYTHRLKVEFESDNDRLGRILFALATAPKIKPEFRLSYTVKDPEAAKNLLLGNAVSDARKKAAILSQAAGVSLKDILSIDYSWGEINLEYVPMRENMVYEDGSGSTVDACLQMDIEPDDIEVKDTVTVVWEIA